MPDQITINESVASQRSTAVAIYDAAGAPVTGLDQTMVTIKIKKPGANFVASTATLVEETSSAEGGSYNLVFPAGEVDTLGDLKFEISSGSSFIARVLGYVTVIAVSAISSDIALVKAQTDKIPLVLALLHHNAKLDKTVYVAGFLTSARLRQFADAAALAAAVGDNPADGAEGEIHRFEIRGVEGARGLVRTYTVSQAL